MKRALLLLALMAGITSFSQSEFVAYTATGKGVAATFVTDYHCLGINPANLGWKATDKRFTTGSSEFGISIYSQSLAKQDLRDNLWSLAQSGDVNALSDSEKIEAAKGFADDFAFNFDYNFFGFSFQQEKFGGIAFSMRSRASWDSGLGSDFSEMLFRGRRSNYFDQLVYVDPTTMIADTIANYENMSPDSAANIASGFRTGIPLRMSEILGQDTYLRASLNREYHLGYGRKILGINDSVVQIYAGVGIKYIEGIAMMDVGINDAGALQVYSAFSPSFDLDYDPAIALANPTALAGDPNNIWRKKIGWGFGADFGVNATFFNKIHLAASVTNIGSMTYTGNLYTAADSIIVSYNGAGIDDMNIGKSVGEMIEEDGLLTVEPDAERKMSLPATLRFGASAELGKFVHVGGELIAPFNDVPGSINGFAWGIGSDFILAKGQVVLMAGFNGGGGYDFQIPLGVNFVLGNGSYEVGIASRDALTFFLKNTPTISAAFGFARVRF